MIRTVLAMNLFCRLRPILCALSFAVASCREEENGVQSDTSPSSFLYYQKAEYERDCKDIFDQCTTNNASGVHIIRPDGYSEPFEVYCHTGIESGGWTVIQRRLDGSLTFKRHWKDYKVGFGFLNTEFWLGNEKLSYLTNQAVYELRIDVLLANGTELHVTYDHFRISDEWSNFSLAHAGTSNTVGAFTECPINSTYGNCSCALTCKDPAGSQGCYSNCVRYENCVCTDGFLIKGNDCIAPNECTCFIHDEGSVIPEGESLVNSDCTVKYSCLDQTLIENRAYSCDPNADCKAVNQIQGCYCREGFDGNGESCMTIFADCLEAYNAGHRENGVYTISPVGWSGLPFKVSCNMDIDGGGWMVFQRRSDGSTDFYRSWENYKQGFGNVSNDYWLGNEKLHFVTSQRSHLLRADIITSDGTPKYDTYASFAIHSESTGYRVSVVGSYTGNNSYPPLHRITGESFSTYDRDNDGWLNHNCAEKHKGAWWYSDNWTNNCHLSGYCNYWYDDGTCRRICTRANPNGEYNGGQGTNIFWFDGYPCYLTYVEMKIRPS